LKKEFHYTEEKQAKAVLVAVSPPQQRKEQTQEYLDELAFLAKTLGVKTLKTFTQNLDKPDPRTFVGKGKLEQISAYIIEEDIDMVIFDDDLSTAHVKNLDRQLKDCLVIDRSLLILQIFMKRAKTAQARTQVELAQYQYMLPRLTNLWTHHSRQRGGIGMKGPGETELETDKRIIRDKIALLKKRLKEIDKQMTVQRKGRGNMIRVALVGYTNVGKSTIMNALAKSEVFAENKLFATLDTTVRKVVIDNLPFLLSDTVGFIRKLPHGLVESFKSTLDEVREADLLLHVVDISHPDFEEQIHTVNETLLEIDSSNKPTMMIFNKIDAYTWIEKEEDDLTEPTRENITLEELKNSWIAKSNSPAVFISAREKSNWDGFKKKVYDKVRKIHVKRYPYNDFLY